MQVSTMVSKITIVVFHIFLILELHPSEAQTWIRVGYYSHASKGFPVADINSSLFTHLICGFAELNSTSYQLSILPSEEKYISTFTETVKRDNPSVTTLLSIGRETDPSTFSSMMSNISYRKWFIDSSIKTARLYGFQGLDLWCASPNMTISDSFNMGILFEEWRAAVGFEARTSSQRQLILTTAVQYSPNLYSGRCPIHSMQRYLNWIHVRHVNFSSPVSTNFTAATAALYNPTNDVNTDNGIRAWIRAGLPANKLVIGLPYYGYAWTLVNFKENGIGAPSTGPAISKNGLLIYSDIKEYIETYGGKVMYNATYVVNYCTIWTSWIGFDDVEAIRTKVSYAKGKGLLGYHVWLVSYDYNWVLSRAAAGKDGGNDFSVKEHKNGQNRWWRSLVIILTTVVAVVLLLCCVIYYRRMRKLKVKGNTVDSVRESENK